MTIELEMRDYETVVSNWAWNMNRGCIHAEYDDLYSAGQLGLWKCLLRFDEKKATELTDKSIWVSWHVRNAMVDHMRTLYHTRTKDPSLYQIFVNYDEVSMGEKDAPVADWHEAFGEAPDFTWEREHDFNVLVEHAQLNSRQSAILEMRFEDYTLREIGDILQVHEVRIHQLIKGTKQEPTGAIRHKLEAARQTLYPNDNPY